MALQNGDVPVLPPVRSIGWELFGTGLALLWVHSGRTLGLVANVCTRPRFYGVLLCQGTSYFRTYAKDPTDVKVTVCSA